MQSAESESAQGHESVQDPEMKSAEQYAEVEKPMRRYSSHRIASQAFLHETSEQDRLILFQELSRVLFNILETDTPVYLERFGILFTTRENRIVSRRIEQKSLIRKEAYRKLVFEKCDDLPPGYEEQYSSLIETPEISKRLHPRLPLTLTIRWSEQDLRRYIRGMIAFLRNEIIQNGHSSLLSEVGNFYALHNRQGEHPSDWYAGANIILEPRSEQITTIGESRIIPEVTFDHALEPFEATYGPPISVLGINLQSELRSLGYDLGSRDMNFSENLFRVGVFRSNNTNEECNSTLIFCTDGIRNLTNSSFQQQKSGTELIVQMKEDEIPPEHQGQLPSWPLRVITLGWLLLNGRESRSLREGLGLSCDIPLSDREETILKAIFTTRHNSFPTPQLSGEGPFQYINLVGISPDEMKIAEEFSPDHLLTLLRFRGLDQCTRLMRQSLLTKTVHQQVYPGQQNNGILSYNS